MKTKHLFGILIAFLCTFSFVSCDNDDDLDFEFTPHALYQTVWKGTLTDFDYNGEIGITFETTGKGSVTCTDPQDPNFIIHDYFTYRIEGKYIYFNGPSILQDGRPWSLTKKSKNKMVLKYNLETVNPQYQSTLELTRVD